MKPAAWTDLMLSGSTLKLTVKRYVIKICAGSEPFSPPHRRCAANPLKSPLEPT
jgi:hypothetical protein